MVDIVLVEAAGELNVPLLVCICCSNASKLMVLRIPPFIQRHYD